MFILRICARELSLVLIPVLVSLHHTPAELRVLGPPRLVPAEAEQGAEHDLRSPPVLLGLSELLEPELEVPLYHGNLMIVKAVHLVDNGTNNSWKGAP